MPPKINHQHQVQFNTGAGTPVSFAAMDAGYKRVTIKKTDGTRVDFAAKKAPAKKR